VKEIADKYSNVEINKKKYLDQRPWLINMKKTKGPAIKVTRPKQEELEKIYLNMPLQQMVSESEKSYKASSKADGYDPNLECRPLQISKAPSKIVAKKMSLADPVVKVSDLSPRRCLPKRPETVLNKNELKA